MLSCLYCLFIIPLCTSNLLSPVGCIPHRLCEQYRYRQWIRRSNIIIIVPDPPPGLSLSVARSADFLASGEDCCCNFSSVWAVNNILCGAASHTVTDAHSAVISGAGSLAPSSHTLPLPMGSTCASWGERRRGGKRVTAHTKMQLRRPCMHHLTPPLWYIVPLNPECVFGKSLKMAVRVGGDCEWARAFFFFKRGGSSRGCNALTGMQNHSVAFDVRSSPWREQCDLWEVEPGRNVIVFIENTGDAWKHHCQGDFCTMVTSRPPPTH